MEIVWFDGSKNPDIAPVLKIRYDVFVEEQNTPYESDYDPKGDSESFHLLLKEEGRDIACGRVRVADGQYSLGRIAVRKEYRSKQYGKMVVELLTNKARQIGAKQLMLNAQTYALDFYTKMGFQPNGGEHDEDGIPHLAMKRIFENENELKEMVSAIEQTNQEQLETAWARLDSLVKPPRSLGQLEEIAAKLSAIRGVNGGRLNKKCVIIMCADNGIVEEGVASAPQDTTVFMTYNFIKGVTGVSVLAKELDADLHIIDIGIKAEMNHPAITDKKIAFGTNNFTKMPAMTRDETVRAIIAGFNSACEAKYKGYDVIGIGEMGIGNTTTASAVLSAITGASPAETVGKGAGLSEDGYETKKRIIESAIHNLQVDSTDIIDIISKVGGLDIAAMAGACLGAAAIKLPVVADGFISTVSALCAVKLNPKTKDYLFLSHASYEKGYKLAAAEIGLDAVLNLNMRLGEGSGCPIMFKIMDCALAVIRDMATFAEGNIGDEYLEKVGSSHSFEVKS